MDSVKLSRMDKSVFSIEPLEAHGNEKEYWASKSPQERLAALEFMRQVMYGYDPNYRPTSESSYHRSAAME